MATKRWVDLKTGEFPPEWEVDTIGENVKRIVIPTSIGDVKILSDTYSLMRVCGTAPPKKVTVYKLSAELPGKIQFSEIFQDEYKRDNRKREMTIEYPEIDFSSSEEESEEEF